MTLDVMIGTHDESHFASNKAEVGHKLPHHTTRQAEALATVGYKNAAVIRGLLSC